MIETQNPRGPAAVLRHPPVDVRRRIRGVTQQPVGQYGGSGTEALGHVDSCAACHDTCDRSGRPCSRGRAGSGLRIFERVERGAVIAIGEGADKIRRTEYESGGGGGTDVERTRALGPGKVHGAGLDWNGDRCVAGAAEHAVGGTLSHLEPLRDPTRLCRCPRDCGPSETVGIHRRTHGVASFIKQIHRDTRGCRQSGPLGEETCARIVVEVMADVAGRRGG